MRDDGVVGVVAAGLLIATLAVFLTVVNVAWVPVWVADAESSRALQLREAVEGFGETLEDHVARNLTGRPFTRALPVGDEGLALFGAGASSGRLAVGAGPTLELREGAVVAATGGGAVVARTQPARFPEQEHAYVLGAMQLAQGEGAWADLRSVVGASRAADGTLDVSVLALTLGGAREEAGANHDLRVTGTVTSVESASRTPSGEVRLVVRGVEADAWRVALDRMLGARSLTLETLSDCTTGTADACLDAEDNAEDALDVRFRNVGELRMTEATVELRVRG